MNLFPVGEKYAFTGGTSVDVFLPFQITGKVKTFGIREAGTMTDISGDKAVPFAMFQVAH